MFCTYKPIHFRFNPLSPKISLTIRYRLAWENHNFFLLGALSWQMLVPVACHPQLLIGYHSLVYFWLLEMVSVRSFLFVKNYWYLWRFGARRESLCFPLSAAIVNRLDSSSILNEGLRRLLDHSSSTPRLVHFYC